MWVIEPGEYPAFPEEVPSLPRIVTGRQHLYRYWAGKLSMYAGKDETETSVTDRVWGDAVGRQSGSRQASSYSRANEHAGSICRQANKGRHVRLYRAGYFGMGVLPKQWFIAYAQPKPISKYALPNPWRLATKRPFLNFR
jgi:hypothetical protein